MSLGQRLPAAGEGEGRIPESPRPPPTSAQLPPGRAARLKSNQTRKSGALSRAGGGSHGLGLELPKWLGPTAYRRRGAR